jgi:hypothetical protein
MQHNVYSIMRRLISQTSPDGGAKQNHRSSRHQIVSTTPTEFWNDSCSVPELPYAIEHGATGATSDPSIVFPVLKTTLGEWKDRAHQIVPGHPTGDEEQIVQQTCEEFGVREVRFALERAGPLAHLDLIWTGAPLGFETTMTWGPRFVQVEAISTAAFALTSPAPAASFSP